MRTVVEEVVGEEEEVGGWGRERERARAREREYGRKCSISSHICLVSRRSNRLSAETDALSILLIFLLNSRRLGLHMHILCLAVLARLGLPWLPQGVEQGSWELHVKRRVGKDLRN